MSINDVCLLTIRDGRDEVHERARASARRMLPEFQYGVAVDDSGHKLGFAGAIQEGWRQVLETGAKYVLHFEADFVFNAPVPLERMVWLLESRPWIVQVSLKRQPWNEEEIAAGGIVEQHPDDFYEKRDGDVVWTEHRRYFTTNVSLYRASLCELGWPQEPRSEGIFTQRLCDDDRLVFAIWGAKYDPPMIEHIGLQRAGHGY